jgi:hypothetical protein
MTREKLVEILSGENCPAFRTDCKACVTDNCSFIGKNIDRILAALEAERNTAKEADGGLIAWAKDHYWDTFTEDKDLIIAHLKNYTPAPPAESLAELAKRKGFNEVMWTEYPEEFGLSVRKYQTGNDDMTLFGGKDYPECEAKARAYLETLPDKPTAGGTDNDKGKEAK